MQNTKENFELKLPDNKVYLTDKGKDQAHRAGKFLKQYIEDNDINLDNATLWVSPFERTRETAKIINEYIGLDDVKEDFLLVEQMYGLFSDNPIEECKKKYPSEFEFYDRLYHNDGKFFAKLPQGESPFDVALRMRLFINSMFRDVNEGKDTFFIVTHGTSMRAFLLAYMHYSPEWFNNEPVMENCSIRMIEKNGKDNIDHDYIYGGRVLVKK